MTHVDFTKMRRSKARHIGTCATCGKNAWILKVPITRGINNKGRVRIQAVHSRDETDLGMRVRVENVEACWYWEDGKP